MIQNCFKKNHLSVYFLDDLFLSVYFLDDIFLMFFCFLFFFSALYSHRKQHGGAPRDLRGRLGVDDVNLRADRRAGPRRGDERRGHFGLPDPPVGARNLQRLPRRHGARSPRCVQLPRPAAAAAGRVASDGGFPDSGLRWAQHGIGGHRERSHQLHCSENQSILEVLMID